MRKKQSESRRKASATGATGSGRKARANGAAGSGRKASKTKATIRSGGLEVSLVEANRRLKSIRVANEVATWVWDVRNDRVVADENLVRLFGVSARDAAGGPIEKYIQVIHPDDRAVVEAAIANALKGPNDRYETNYRLVRKNGDTLWVSARGTVERDAAGNPIYFPGVVIDISELRATQQKSDELRFQLDQQARVLDITLSHISDFAYIFNRDGRFVFVNQSLLNLWGLKLEDAVGKNFFDLKYPDELAARLQQQIQTVFDTKTACGTRLRIPAKPARAAITNTYFGRCSTEKETSSWWRAPLAILLTANKWKRICGRVRKAFACLLNRWNIRFRSERKNCKCVPIMCNSNQICFASFRCD
jgi:PAS domain S-box-containing protein